MLKLPDVTLVAVDTACHALTAQALRDCMSRAEFGGVLTLSDLCLLPDINAHMHFTGTSAADAERAIWHVVPYEVTTSHFLWVQWDSWVIDSAQWTDEYLKYDYIGAPWWYADNKNIGNGGFSLRSTRLMRHLNENLRYRPFRQPEDETLCRDYRPALENDGYRWAPDQLAYRFSYERVRQRGKTWVEVFDNVYSCKGDELALQPTFGFHGMFNWPNVLTEAQIDERLADAPKYVRDHVHYKEMRANLEAFRVA